MWQPSQVSLTEEEMFSLLPARLSVSLSCSCKSLTVPLVLWPMRVIVCFSIF